MLKKVFCVTLRQIKNNNMKKYMMSMAVALMAAFTFVACGSDPVDPPTPDPVKPNDPRLAGTSWFVERELDGEGGMINFQDTVTFTDKEKGVEHIHVCFTILKELFPECDVYSEFTYSFDGAKGVKHIKKTTLIYNEHVTVSTTESDSEFGYDEKAKIIFSGENESRLELKPCKPVFFGVLPEATNSRVVLNKEDLKGSWFGTCVIPVIFPALWDMTITDNTFSLCCEKLSDNVYDNAEYSLNGDKILIGEKKDVITVLFLNDRVMMAFAYNKHLKMNAFHMFLKK